MNKLTITLPNKTTVQVSPGTLAKSLLPSLAEDIDDVLAVKINNKTASLEKPLTFNASLTPVLLGTKEGSVVYRRSLCLLLATATHSLFPGRKLLVGHSLEYGYYYTFDGITPSIEDVAMIESRMLDLVQKNLPIRMYSISYDDAREVFSASGLTGSLHLLDFKCPPIVKVCAIDLGGESPLYDLYFGPLVASTGVLRTFSLMPYQDGFLLRFPPTNRSENLPPFHDQPKLFETYCRYKDWGKKLGVRNVADLNALVTSGKIGDFIDITETQQRQCIADIAHSIVKKSGVRVVLIAGPSSSGKTTTSKKLAIELRALGLNPKVISLDCYYAGHDRTPRDENGNLDFECLEALDVTLLNQNLIDLFDGKEVNIPSYDFHTGRQYFTEDDKMHLGTSDILIMEGIHALNDRLTPLINNDLKFKIYLSALTQLNIDDHNRISTSDNRLIRRIVRDYQFRGKSAAGTIGMWPSVRKGEELHIFPYQNNADAILNTALDYELCVLKVFAEPLLRCVKPSEEQYSEACTLLDFLDVFATIDSRFVPERSILREFIGGSSFKY